MLETATPPLLDELDPATSPLKFGWEKIVDNYALSLVKQTFERYQSWRALNHDPRWRAHTNLYFGAVPQKVWPGTNIPRAALSTYTVFEQVETAVPAIMQALFSSDEWFDVAAEPGANPQEARQIQARLRYLLEHVKNQYGHTAIMEFEQAIQSVCLHGNGVVHVSWDGEMKRPQVEWVDLRDIYIDPYTPTPNLNEGRSLVHRRLMTVDELEAFRGNPQMSIPSPPILIHMAQSRPVTVGDTTIQLQESQRGVSYQPGGSDNLPLPADNLIEVLVYVSKTRIIWVLNREWVAYNRENPYGFIPYFMAPCYSVLKRCYAMSMADVLEPNQLYSEGLLNNHLDEINLATLPPRIRKRGSAMTPSQFRWHPGSVNEFADPQKDFAVHFPSGATANVQAELAYLETASERRTGVNSLGQGVAKPGNVFRTSGGISALQQGSSLRLQPIVKRVEDYILVPVLYAFYRMIQYHSQGESAPGMDKGGQTIQVPASSFDAPVQFRMRSASKMLTREKLQQVLPVISQNIFAGPIIGQLNKTGWTADYAEYFRMMQDATGTAEKYQIIRQLTPEEQQALAQPDPATQAKERQSQLDAQTRIQMGELKSETERLKAQLEHDADTSETEERSAREILKLVFSELQAGAESEQMRQKLILAEREAAQKLNHKELEHSVKMRHMTEAAQLKSQVDQFGAQQQLMTGGMKLQGQMELDRAKLDHQKEQLKAKESMSAGTKALASGGKKKPKKGK